MASVANKVFLIGPMGSGKSAVGKYLARSLRFPFVDSDAEIEARTGVDIPFIFEREGEAGFRQREREVLDELTQRMPIVLATGGGAVLFPENRQALRERGFVVYLETAVEQQAERVRQSRNRPLLHSVDATTRLQDLMTVRAPLYEALADLKVSTDRQRVQAVAAEIRAALKSLPAPD
ncbi:MAG TPA: shikimate kinase AroK [Steroidobacteraceae bacterium]|nr:shikimate kinase AroK [Steroidobacteraceae bacterium]